MGEFRSAEQNPFRISQLESIQWLPTPSSLDGIYCKWSEHDFRGQINGCHGAGKTTLAHKLQEKLEAAEIPSEYLFANLQEKPFSDWDKIIKEKSEDSVIFLDGIGHASFIKKRGLIKHCKRFLCLVHEPLKNIPVICHLEPEGRLLEDLCFNLAGKEGIQLLEKAGGASELLKKHNQNFRDCFFDLYRFWSRQ